MVFDSINSEFQEMTLKILSGNTYQLCPHLMIRRLDGRGVSLGFATRQRSLTLLAAPSRERGQREERGRTKTLFFGVQ